MNRLLPITIAAGSAPIRGTRYGALNWLWRSLRPLVLVLMVSPLSVLAEVEQVTNEELKALRDQGVVLIDVRREDEWQRSGIIEGSQLLTFFDRRGRYDVNQWLQDLEAIAPGDTPFLLICEVGGRTGNISKLLERMPDYGANADRATRVHNLTRGIRHWIAKGQSVVPYQP